LDQHCDINVILAEFLTLLPHINTLVLDINGEDIFHSFWAVLHCALLVRCTGCLLVHITLLYYFIQFVVTHHTHFFFIVALVLSQFVGFLLDFNCIKNS
jgi:hypothetical protein